MKFLFIAVTTMVLLSTGCMMGPNYKRPTVPVPPTYRGAQAPSTSGSPGAASFGNLEWWKVFHDPVLQTLVRTALKQNYSLRIAAARIVQAQGELGVTRSQEFPQINGDFNASRQKTLLSPSFPAIQSSSFQLGGSASWLLDFWGRYRRATQAARAALLASEYSQRAVKVTLVSEIVTDYYQLRELDWELQISEATLKSRQDSLRLTQIRQQGGVASMLDVRQAESLVQTAETTITDTRRLISQQEDALSVLLGENPASIPRGLSLEDETIALSLPAGLPSSLLERRPDIREAEEGLISANAEIGVARAEFFPQISLTGSGGAQSFQLLNLFTNGVWSFGGDLAQPIFTAGRLRGNLRAVRAQEQEALFQYKQTVQEAFREVSDALIGYQRNREFLAQQRALTQSDADAVQLARAQYRGGVTSYLDVLTQDTQYFTAQLGLAQARFNELSSVVQIYQALGGGWQP